MLASFAGASGAVLLLSAAIRFFSLFLRQVFVHDNFLLNDINTGLAKRWGFAAARAVCCLFPSLPSPTAERTLSVPSGIKPGFLSLLPACGHLPPLAEEGIFCAGFGIGQPPSGINTGLFNTRQAGQVRAFLLYRFAWRGQARRLVGFQRVVVVAFRVGDVDAVHAAGLP